MKSDSILFFISLFFSLVGLLVKDVTSSNMIEVSLLRYIPILILYIKKIKWSYAAVLPILFWFGMFALYRISWCQYSIPGMLVIGMLPVYFYVYNRITFSHDEISFIILLFVLAYLAYVVISDNHSINPNQVGFTFLILSVDIFICIFVNYPNSVIKNFSILFLLFTTFLLIINTESRNSLMVFLIVIVSFFFKGRVMKYKSLILFVILILYVLYPWIYCIYAEYYRYGLVNDTKVMGQDVFSGRQYIWVYILYRILDPAYFWFGGIDTEWWGKSNHNSALDIITRYGVPSLILFFSIMYFYFIESFKLVTGKYKSLLLLILVTMIWGMNESGLFLGYSFFLLLPISILRSKRIIYHKRLL